MMRKILILLTVTSLFLCVQARAENTAEPYAGRVSPGSKMNDPFNPASEGIYLAKSMMGSLDYAFVSKDYKPEPVELQPVQNTRSEKKKKGRRDKYPFLKKEDKETLAKLHGKIVSDILEDQTTKEFKKQVEDAEIVNRILVAIIESYGGDIYAWKSAARSKARMTILKLSEFNPELVENYFFTLEAEYRKSVLQWLDMEWNGIKPVERMPLPQPATHWRKLSQSLSD